MTMEPPPFEDVFPIQNGDFPSSHVNFREFIYIWSILFMGFMSVNLPIIVPWILLHLRFELVGVKVTLMGGKRNLSKP